MTNTIKNPSKSIDTSYLKPVLTDKDTTTKQITNSIKEILDITPEDYKNELLSRISYFIDDLNNDFADEDYTSNYTWYIKLIEDYISQLEKLAIFYSSINIEELSQKLKKIKENQIIAKIEQEKQNVKRLEEKRKKEKEEENKINNPYSQKEIKIFKKI